jgi:hypothetical protein
LAEGWVLIVPAIYFVETLLWLLAVKNHLPFAWFRDFMVRYGHHINLGLFLLYLIQVTLQFAGILSLLLRTNSIYAAGLDRKSAREDVLFELLMSLPTDATRERERRIKFEVSLLEKSGLLAFSLPVITVLSRDLGILDPKIDHTTVRVMLETFTFCLWVVGYLLLSLRMELLRLAYVLDRASERRISSAR